jgi:hypothetical protein
MRTRVPGWQNRRRGLLEEIKLAVEALAADLSQLEQRPAYAALVRKPERELWPL